MKKTKKLLVGFILLWAAGFVVVWGITVFKNSPFKKISSGIEMTKAGMPGISSGSEEASDAVPVRCYRAGLTDFKDDLPVMGTVKAELEINLKFELNGVIESINFREGDIIYKGDLIAALKKKDVQLKVDYAKSKLESAKVQFLSAKNKHQIFKNLYDIGGIIKAKLEEAKLEAKNAELQIVSNEVELRSAEAEFEKTNLYAPRDGVLGSRDAEIGEFVTPQDKIATLYDTVKVFVELGIVEKDIDKIALGQNTRVTVDAYSGTNFTGTVDYVFPVIEGKSRTLTLKVGIQNPDALLLPGMFARAVITVAEFKNAIVVPSLSLNKRDDGYEIFTVGENNTVSSRPVEVAYVTTDYTVIDSGLYEGELVITDAPQELKDGMRVNIIEVEESSIGE